MPTNTPSRPLIIALAGNPNSGKTTIFNALTGAHQKVGNYAGVTVERKEGSCLHNGERLTIVDLPGTYSLTAYSLDEVVARDFLLNETPDLIINVIDATNLERNLYLCLQFQELGIPIVGALNMVDQAEHRGFQINRETLSALLAIPMVKTVGMRGEGLSELLDTALRVARSKEAPSPTTSYGAEIEKEIATVEAILRTDESTVRRYPVHWIAVKLLEQDEHVSALIATHPASERLRTTVEKSVRWIEKHYGSKAQIVISEQRYGYIHGAVSEAVKKPPIDQKTITESVDAILINRYLGLPIFFGILWILFHFTFTLGAYPMAWLEAGFAALADLANTQITDPTIRSLIADGVIGGVGGVLSFAPLITLLFLGIALMEDTGYMARAAFLMDSVLHRFGLHGQSFIPLMIGFGCSVPAIMAARGLKSPKDRIITILVIPLMSCGARLPVYALLIGAFFPKEIGANVLLSIYAIGILIALLVAKVLRMTVFKGVSSPFVMELPPYRVPTLRGILWHVGQKLLSYTRKAGTVILGAAVAIWALTTYPTLPADPTRDAQFRAEAEAESLRLIPTTNQAGRDADISGRVVGRMHQAALAKSYAGQVGAVIEPVLRPLGLDGRIGVALLTGLAAKETVVSTLGILYRPATGGDEHSLGSALRSSGLTAASAYALMLFILIYAPCVAALATLRAELGTRWLIFALCYTLLLAWLVAFVGYTIGTRLGG